MWLFTVGINDASAAPAEQVRYKQCQNTSDPGHFGPKTFRHHHTGAEVSGQFGTSAEVSARHFGTGVELSSSPANITATIGCTEVSK